MYKYNIYQKKFRQQQTSREKAKAKENIPIDGVGGRRRSGVASEAAKP